MKLYCANGREQNRLRAPLHVALHDAPLRWGMGAQTPRTLAAFLRDGAPIPAALAERLIAIDTQRHPTLTEMRMALGLDLDISAIGDAALAAWPARGAEPSDRDLAGVLDAMYRAIASTRMLRVELDGDGPVVSRAPNPIVVRDEEHLVLLAFADNRTDGVVQFSAEAHGEGVGGLVEARRTGSTLFDAGSMHPGAFLLPVLIAADGKTTTLDIPIECKPSGMIRVRIVDDETGEPIAARVYLTDAVGAAWPGSAQIRVDVHGNAWFHADGAFTARVSGKARLRVVRGIEYEAAESEIAVPPDGEVETTVRLRRWSHMAADGWYSGDVHVHLHYGGEYELTPADASLAQRAEDVNFLNMMVANQGSGWVHDREHFDGADSPFSDASHVLRWGEEYRNNLYGHMCLFGIDALVPPIYSGFAGSEHRHDLPANSEAAAHCHTIGGTISYAHPMFDRIDLDRVFSESDTHSVEAKELPVDAALGLIDAVDVMSYPGSNIETAKLWYKLLNCGLRLAATAGTDTFMNCADQDEFSNPPAGDRVFVRVDGALSTPSWCEGVRAGRTFVTNAPMLSLEATAGGAATPNHGIGDEIAAHAGDVLRIHAEAGSHVPMERIDLIVNGEVVASANAGRGGQHAVLAYDLEVRESCWIALRATGPAHDLVLDPKGNIAAEPEGVFAHTSPIYIMVGGAAVAKPDDAAYFVDWIDRLIAMCAKVGRYPSDEERDAVAAIFRKGQAHYANIVAGH